MSDWIPAVFSAKYKERNISPTITSKALRIVKKFKDTKFPIILSLGHLAFRTNTKYWVVHKFVNRTSFEQYRYFRIRKHTKGYRLISIPTQDLMKVQRWINKYILLQLPQSKYSYAYQHKKSIKNCAEQHLLCKWLIKIDLQQFFDSISEKQVYSVFQSIGYSNLVSFELARLCTDVYKPLQKKYENPVWVSTKKYNLFNNQYLGSLPQGAPTSPLLANYIAKPLDMKIANYTERRNIVYTRYADDLIFSSSDENFSMNDALNLVHFVYNILPQYGFNPNHNKTKILKPGSRKIVLGLLVDTEQVRLSKTFKSNLEVHLFCIKKDQIAHTKTRNFDSLYGLKHYIEGLISYVKMVDIAYFEKLKKKKLYPIKWKVEG